MKSSILKYMAYGLGSTSLIGGSFFLFAALSGTPMNEMGVIGNAFPRDDPPPVSASQELTHPQDELEKDRRSPEEVIDSTQSPLRGTIFPNPWSASELEQLEEQLQSRMRALDSRERKLAEKEYELEEEQRHYEDLFADLEELRTSVLEADQERIAQEEELSRDKKALEERESQTLRDLSTIYQEGKPKDMAKMLQDAWDADQAALILSALPTDRAGALLVEIYKLDAVKGATYQDAYRKVGPGR